MPRAFLTKVGVPFLILTIATASFWWLRSMRTPPRRATRAPLPPLVETVLLQPAASGFEIKVHGVVVPRRETTVAAEVDGEIIEKHESFRSGQFVKKDEILVRIEPQRYELELELQNNLLLQIESDLKQIAVEATNIQAQIKIAVREVAIAQRELQRNQALVEDDVIAQQQSDESERILLRTQNMLSALENARELLPFKRQRAQAELKLARLRQQTAQLDLDDTAIIAPFDGLITAETIEVGEYVSEGDPLLTIEEAPAVEVKCNLRTDDLFWLWSENSSRPGDDETSAYELPATDVRVAFQIAGREFLWKGRLTRYEHAGVDEKTRTVPCRVEILDRRRTNQPAGPPALMRGVFVTVVIPVSPGIPMLEVPHRALQPNGQVWVVENDRLRIHSVTPVKSLVNGILIRADDAKLKSGDRIVVSRLITAQDGMQVRERALP